MCMQLTKIKIKNYRLLVNAELEVDPKTTLIVGRNNTAKTSCFSCIENVLKKETISLMTIRYQSEIISIPKLHCLWRKSSRMKNFVNKSKLLP